MSVFKGSVLFALIYITSLSLPDQASGAPIQCDTLTESAADYPVKFPGQVLKKLVDNSDRSKGLFSLWRNSLNLTKERILKTKYMDLKYRVCRGLVFREIPRHTVCQNTITCLKRSQLVNYYNELVIHLRTAENLVNTSIYREINEGSRATVEKQQRKVIEMLRENILPLMSVALNATIDEMDCNTTETIVNKKTSIYSQYCASIQTTNLFLSQTTNNLYRILRAIYLANMNNPEDHSSKDNEMIISHFDKPKEWCIL